MVRRARGWLLLAALAWLPSAAHASPSALRTGSANTLSYTHTGPDSRFQGYMVELWRLWSRQTDHHALPWRSAQRTMHDGSADVIYRLYRPPGRDRPHTFLYPRASTLYLTRFQQIVHQGNAATLARNKQGMAGITASEWYRLKDTWPGHTLHYRPYVEYTLILALIALGAIIVFSFWIWVLRRAVRARTAEIREKNDQLEQQTHKLVIERAQLRTLVESSPDAMWVKNADGLYVDCNTRACELLGKPRQSIVGHSDDELFDDLELVAKAHEIDKKVWATDKQNSDEFHFVSGDGKARDMELVKVPIHAPDGKINGVLGVARDVTQRRRIEEELRISAAAFESQDGIVICDARGVIQRVNASFTRITGYTSGQVIDLTLKELMDAHMRNARFYSDLNKAVTEVSGWTGDVWIHTSNGSLCFVRMTVTQVCNDRNRLRHTVLSIHDLTAEHEARTRAEHLEKYDPLTDLPNRRMLEQCLHEANVGADDGPADTLCHGALLLVGLDNFAIVNNAHGHQLGDRILQQAAQRMRYLLPTGATLSHISGDEFGVILPSSPSSRSEASDAAHAFAHDLRMALGKPYNFPKIGEVICTASVGGTLLCRPLRSPDTLIGEAELAMYKAKQAGKNAVRLFESGMQAEIDARNALAQDMREGMNSDQFHLHFQPLVDTFGKVVAAEALLRWDHPERGPISPEEFISVAELTGQIEILGRLVLQQACLTLANWSALPEMRNLVLSVNVSPRQFRQVDFVQQVITTISAYRTDTSHLKFEITESVAMENIQETANRIETLKQSGIRVSLDDFGTGSSALSYLTLLPLDQLKIDKSFVQNLPDSHTDAHVARSILGLAHGMGLEVVAEGVETREQYEFLRKHKCDLFQGYLFGKPMPVSEFEQHVRKTNAQHGSPGRGHAGVSRQKRGTQP